VRPDVTLAYMEAYMDRLCPAAGKVRMLLLPGVDHAFIARDSAKAALDWTCARFTGIRPPSDCSGRGTLSASGPPLRPGSVFDLSRDDAA
jgi:hypothetical protein